MRLMTFCCNIYERAEFETVEYMTFCFQKHLNKNTKLSSKKWKASGPEENDAKNDCDLRPR